MTGLIRYESADHVATITINRADKRNAFSGPLCAELRAAWQRFEAGDDRVAVLAAAGDQEFSVGADLKEVPTNFWQSVPGIGVAVTKPIVSAPFGWCVGGGFIMVQMSDLCVAADNTRFLYPEGKIGLTGGMVTSIAVRLPHKVAMEFMLTGDPLSAQRAYDLGFVNKVVPAGQQVQAAQDYARTIAANAPLVNRALKRLVAETLPASPVEKLYETRRLLDEITDSADLHEGMAAFREKRKPKFTGK